MCILLIAYRSHPDYDLVVAANRDEFYARGTAPADYWGDYPSVLGGRDLVAGGTWLGVNTAGYFSAVTNMRGSISPSPEHSRGHLVRDFLRLSIDCTAYLEKIAPTAPHYAGCNLLVEDRSALHWWSKTGTRRLEAGVYALSNTELDHEWPKVGRLKSAFAPLSLVSGVALEDGLFEILRDRPNSRAGLHAEAFNRGLLEDVIFVRADGYGTRCSTVVLRGPGKLKFIERGFDHTGNALPDLR
ncbi:MAG: NRDE family protein, partial [Gammaproteobacteria bacterium]